MRKRLLSTILALCVALALPPWAAASGSLGIHLTWRVEDRVLVIEGTGSMAPYASASSQPWYTSRYSIIGIRIENGLLNISESAFNDLIEVKSVAIPDSVGSIGISAFANCANLTGVAMPDSVFRMGAGAFANCVRLSSVTLSNRLESIAARVFYQCSSLTGVDIPGGVASIGERAFYGCESLTGVTIPAAVTSIGNQAFGNCGSLTDVYYGGTREQWEQISIGDGNEPLANAVIHCASEAESPADYVEEAKIASSGSDRSTVRITGGTLPEDALVFAARQEGGRFAEAASGTFSGDGLIDFDCLLAEGGKLFFLSGDFIPLGPAVKITA